MFHPVDIHVGKKLKALRIYRGFIQKDVADSLKISFQQLQKYETGANRVSASRLYEIARLFVTNCNYNVKVPSLCSK